jgi:hypothetical protein
MSFNKKFFTTGGIVASTPSAPAGLDPLQNFETVTYTGNGSTQKITGYIRKGAAFNGSSSKIDLPNSLDLATGNNNFTVSFWVNTNDTSNDEVYISLLYNYFFYVRKFNTNEIYIELGNSASVNTGVPLTQNVWTHIAVTKSSSTGLILYKDGTAVATYSSKTGNIGAGGDPNQIGIYNNSSSYAVNGKIDQVRLFNTALNPTQVGELALEEYGDAENSVTDFFGNGSGVALYELDEDANDTGRGTIDSGQSAVFNGSSSYIDLGNNSSNNGNVISLSFWFKTTATSGFIYSNGGLDGGSTGQAILINGTGTLRFGETGGLDVSGTTAINDGNWHHLVVTYNSGTLNAYLDGNTTPEMTGTSSGYTTSDQNFIIGREARTASGYFNGEIDQFRIYSSILSTSDVEALVSETNVPTANLVAHYKLDGDATDETTNYDGTWGGTEAYSDPAEFPVYNGTPTNVNFLGMAFQPDLVWVKGRNSGQDNVLFDSVRGVQKQIISNFTDAESTKTNALSSFDSNGFTTGINNSLNANSVTYVAWCWKAGGSVTPNNNTEGSIASTVSANQDAGFSIVSFTAPSTEQNFTVGHGLSQKPDMVILKSRDGGAWFVWHKDLSQESYYLYLQETYSESDLTQDTRIWGQQSFTDSVISTRSNYTVLNNNDVIAYCFHSVDGYQKVGIYSGGQTLNTDNIVDFGFTPRFVIVKNITAATGWLMIDSIRPNGYALFANDFGTEADYSGHIKLSSSGLRFDGNNNNVNASGNNYIYLAIA